MRFEYIILCCLNDGQASFSCVIRSLFYKNPHTPSSSFIIAVQEGASTQVFLAAAELSPSVAGKFFSDGKVIQVQSFATDEEKAEELWALSEKLSGVKFDL